MKIINPVDGTLTNFEVLDFLRSRGASRDPTRAIELKASEFKVYDFLVQSAACNQTRERIKEFVKRSKEYNLQKHELFNIINIGPLTPVYIEPIVDNWTKQFEKGKEKSIAGLLDLVTEVLLPHPNEPVPEEGAEEQNESGSSEQMSV